MVVGTVPNNYAAACGYEVEFVNTSHFPLSHVQLELYIMLAVNNDNAEAKTCQEHIWTKQRMVGKDWDPLESPWHRAPRYPIMSLKLFVI